MVAKDQRLGFEQHAGALDLGTRIDTGGIVIGLLGPVDDEQGVERGQPLDSGRSAAQTEN